MLGFSVKIEHKEKAIGYWTDDGEIYSSLLKLVKRGYAEEVEIHSGYPNVYRMKYKWLGFLLQYGIEPKTSYGFKLDTHHMHTEADSWVTITLWDQS